MTDYNKYNTNIVLEVAMKDPEVPGAKHPGYFQAIPSDQLPRNISQEIENANMHNFGIDVENLQKYEDMIFDAGTGGAPMAIGTVAKGGKSLLSSFLKKLTRKDQQKVIDDLITKMEPGPEHMLKKNLSPAQRSALGAKVGKQHTAVDLGRFDDVHAGYTGGRFSRGTPSTTGAVPGGSTVKRTGVDPVQSPSGIEASYRNTILKLRGKDGLKNFDYQLRGAMNSVKDNWNTHSVDMRYNRIGAKSFPKEGTRHYLEIRNKLVRLLANEM